jgi:hypothetical protein
MMEKIPTTGARDQLLADLKTVIHEAWLRHGSSLTGEQRGRQGQVRKRHHERQG